MIRRWIRHLLAIMGCAAMLVGFGYGGTIAYLSWREQVSPSTQRILVLQNGQQIPLVQPTSLPRMPVSSAAPEIPSGVTNVLSVTPVPPAPVETSLPPVRIVIPKISVDWPVVLSDNDHMPQFQGVGWLMGSGFPGASGNMVLFGHLGGPYGTFMRLHELQQGDEFSVFTQVGEQRYRVRSTYETTPDDVAALAPTNHASATLITCSGPWNPVAQTNERRLIVLADYLQPLASAQK
ncbi:MAG TPA: class F sortase [Roseiflexaceae bacterium]|nr:class F sortase [Roseiflexaceae bacterium]